MINSCIETQGTDTYLVVELPKNSIKDSVGIGMLQNNKIHGLSKLSVVKIDDKELLRYNVSSHITLEQVFQGCVDKKRFLTILRNILETIKTLDEFMMEPEYLLLSKNDIYVNVGTMKTLLIYYPVKSETRKFDVRSFVKEMIMNMEFDSREDNAYVPELINSLNRVNNVNVDDILAEIEILRKTTPNNNHKNEEYHNNNMFESIPVQQNAGMMNIPQMNNTPSSFVAQGISSIPNYENQEKEDIEYKAEAKEKAIFSLFGKKKTKESKQPEEKKSLFSLSLPKSKGETSKKNKEDIVTPAGIVIPGVENRKNSTLPAPPKPKSATNLNNNVVKQPQMPKPQMVQPQMVQPQMVQPQMVQPQMVQPQMAQPQMVQPQMVQPQMVQPQMVQPQMVQPQMNQAPVYPSNQEIMSIGCSDETTVLTNEKIVTAQRRRAYIVRRRTNEKVEITKDIFKIGKERSYVDYCVANNSAISRSHADIIYKDNQYYIVDNNSLNHTFVNDNQIQSQKPVLLEEFARIKMADEVFEFHY